MRTGLIALLLVVFWLGLSHQQQQKPVVIIDTDVDIDDLWAIAYLVKSPYVDVIGITCSGNGWSDPIYGVPNTLHLLNDLGCPDIPVSYGASVPESFLSPSDRLTGAVSLDLKRSIDNYYPVCLGEPLDYTVQQNTPPSAQLIVDLVQNSERKVDILILGGATNVARALVLNPSIKDNIGSIYFSGGSFDNNTVSTNATYPYLTKTKGSSWNIFIDPLAAQRVFDSGIPILMMTSQAQNFLIVNQSIATNLATQYNVDPRLLNLVIKLAPCSGLPESAINYWDPSAAAFYEQTVINGTADFCTEYSYVNGIVNLIGFGDFGRTLYSGKNTTRILTCVAADDEIFAREYWQRMSMPSICPPVSPIETAPDGYELQKMVQNLQSQLATLTQRVAELSASNPPSASTDINFNFANMFTGALRQ